MPQDLLTKEGRQACWDAKDSFWKCMDANNSDESKCKPQREIFVKDCSKTWVKYFDRRRGYLQFKSDLEAGKKDILTDIKK